MDAPAASGTGLAIRGLTIGYRTRRGMFQVLRGVDLDVPRGTVVGLVGESGSGKSTLAFSIVRYLGQNAEVMGGTIELDGEDLLGLAPARLETLRGSGIGMVYQDPGTALNPTLRLGEQLVEGLIRHERLGRRAAYARGAELLAMVHLPDPRFIMQRFPHEVSGGEKQRVLIAMAFACRPALMIFDEPTTALDATTAAGILDLIHRLQAETSIGVLYITHDLGNVARVARRVNVIYGGQILEEGPVEEVLRRPRHPYTRVLMASVPNPFRADVRRRLTSFAGLQPDLHAPPRGCIFQHRCPFVEDACRAGATPLRDIARSRSACVRDDVAATQPLPRPASVLASAEPGAAPPSLLEIENVHVVYGRRRFLDQVLGRPSVRVHAVTGVNLRLPVGKTVGLVGESGCGKSTLARCLVGLLPFTGFIRVDDGTIMTGPADVTRDYRRSVQIVFQNPDLSMNPYMTVGQLIARPLQLYGATGGNVRARVRELLDQVRLPAGYARRHPHELSGGEKQRVAIARAFGPQPRLVICDEIASSLDVSVQASILNLLADLQDAFGTTYLFISHDLNLVQHFADEIAVMYLGRIVEARGASEMLAPPFHPYTEALLSAVPVPEPTVRARRVRLEGPLPSPKNLPAGCVFSTRCPRKVGSKCETEMPVLLPVADAHALACHVPIEELSAVAPIWSPRGPAEPAA